MSQLASGQAAAKHTPQKLQMYRRYFEKFDINGDGVISAQELQKVSRKLGYRFTQEQLDEIMRANDLDRNGCLTFDEFLTAMPCNFENISSDEHKMADIRRKFQEFDQDGNGLVSLDEAHDILRKELAFTPVQTEELVKRYDKNGDGHLSYEEFVRFYGKVTSKAAQIKAMFHEFDKDGSGSISVEEARHMLKKLDIPDDEVRTLVALHDKNNDGELQYEEFITFILHS